MKAYYIDYLQLTGEFESFLTVKKAAQEDIPEQIKTVLKKAPDFK